MKRARLDAAVRNTILLAGFVLLVVLNFNSVLSGIGYVIGIFYPFLLGCFIAFILNIPMNFFETKVFGDKPSGKKGLPKKMRRPLSLIITITLAVVLVWLSIIYLIPMLTSALSSLGQTLEAALPVWEAWIEEHLAGFPNVLSWYHENMPKEVHFDKILTAALDFLRNGAVGSAGVLNVVSQVANTALHSIIAVVAAFYLCVSKEQSWSWLTKALYAIVPKRIGDEIVNISGYAFDIFHKFISGQCLESLLLILIVAVVMSALRIPYSILIAIVCGFCCFIPMFGAFIAGALGAIMVLSADTGKIAIFLIVFIIIRLFDDNYMYPHIMGKSIGLPPVLVLIAITVGGALFGFGGMLLFIPITSIIRKAVLRVVDLRLEKKGITVVENGADIQVFETPSPGAETDKAGEK